MRGALDLSFAYIVINRVEDLNLNLSIPFNYAIFIERGTRFTSIFIEDDEALSIWTRALSPLCIQTTFHEDFTALQKLGEGSFGSVYLVEKNREDKKRFAVKAFSKKDLNKKDESSKTITNEINLMVKLSDSPNFPTYYATYETDNTVYMVMEVIEGKPLLDLGFMSPIDE